MRDIRFLARLTVWPALLILWPFYRSGNIADRLGSWLIELADPEMRTPQP